MDKEGLTPLDWATYTKQNLLVALLRRHAAKYGDGLR